MVRRAFPCPTLLALSCGRPVRRQQRIPLLVPNVCLLPPALVAAQHCSAGNLLSPLRILLATIIIRHTRRLARRTACHLMQMSANEVMKVEFYDDDLIGDEFLGSFTFDIGEELRKLPIDCRNAEWHQAFPLEKARTRLRHSPVDAH